MREEISVANHLSTQEVRRKMQMRGGFFQMQKWLVIYNLLIDPRPLSEIAMHTGLSEGTVRRVMDEYNSLGPEAIDGMGREDSSRDGFVERLKSMFL
jgi:hypothetical protein